MVKYLGSILQQELNPETWAYLTTVAEKLKTTDRVSALLTAFTAMPRLTGKAILKLNTEDMEEHNRVCSGFTLQNYKADRLARIWLLLQFPAEDKTTYLKTIGQLFKAAEMNELVALYGALPLLAYPEEWVKQCTEGIRSNIGIVLEAIMCDNTYPSKYLDQAAWNQLVLKAFFTEKPVNRIIGLDERANKTLALILSDYAHERWAAGRTVDPLLWRLTGKFIDERIFTDIENVFNQGSGIEKAAAALACYQSEYVPAKVLLDKHQELRYAIESNQLNWDYIAHQAQISSI